MTKNTGKPSEKIFDDHFTFLGKKAYVHAFTDASEVNGMNRGHRRIMNVKAQPADRLVVLDGEMFLAEVKSSVSKDDRFDFKLLRITQGSAAAQALAAGGQYWVYYHHLSTDEWFRFPYSLVSEAKAAGVSSLQLAHLRAAQLTWIP